MICYGLHNVDQINFIQRFSCLSSYHPGIYLNYNGLYVFAIIIVESAMEYANMCPFIK